MDKIELIKAEIDKLFSSVVAKHKTDCYADLLSFINSLPEDEPSENIGQLNSEDLEEAAEDYAYINWESDDYHEGADKGLPFDAIGHTAKCFKDGAEWQKKQMMKDAVNGEYDNTSPRAECIWLDEPLKRNNGDKVKIIIVMEDEK